MRVLDVCTIYTTNTYIIHTRTGSWYSNTRWTLHKSEGGSWWWGGVRWWGEWGRRVSARICACACVCVCLCEHMKDEGQLGSQATAQKYKASRETSTNTHIGAPICKPTHTHSHTFYMWVYIVYVCWCGQRHIGRYVQSCYKRCGWECSSSRDIYLYVLGSVCIEKPGRSKAASIQTMRGQLTQRKLTITPSCSTHSHTCTRTYPHIESHIQTYSRFTKPSVDFVVVVVVGRCGAGVSLNKERVRFRDDAA